LIDKNGRKIKKKIEEKEEGGAAMKRWERRSVRFLVKFTS